jgi:hypothetical protein
VNNVKVNRTRTVAELEKLLEKAQSQLAVQCGVVKNQGREMDILRLETVRMKGIIDRSGRQSQGTGKDVGGSGGPREEGGPDTAEGGPDEAIEVSRVEDEPWCEARFLCPLSGLLMRKPVLMSDGHTYEESVAIAHLRLHPDDPKSPLEPFAPLPHLHLMPNLFARGAIQAVCPYNIDDIPAPCGLAWMPFDLMLEMCGTLSAAELCRLSCVSLQLKDFAKQDSVWHEVLVRELQIDPDTVRCNDYKAQYRNVYVQRFFPGDKVPLPPRKTGTTYGVSLRPKTAR